MEAGRLTISKISLLDSGMYQCVAENEHGSVYASAELKVVGKQVCLPCVVYNKPNHRRSRDMPSAHCITHGMKGLPI